MPKGPSGQKRKTPPTARKSKTRQPLFRDDSGKPVEASEEQVGDVADQITRGPKPKSRPKA